MSDITALMVEEGASVGDVVSEGAGMVACAFGSLASAVLLSLAAAWVAASFCRRLRKAEFEKVESFSMAEVHRFSAASLITRSTNDIAQIQMAVAMGIPVTIKAPILAVWAITKIYGKGWQWTLATAVAVAAMMAVVAVLLLYVGPRFRRIQWLTDNLNRATEEGLSGIRVIRAYNAEEHQEARFEEANGELTSNNLSASRALSAMMPAMTAILSLLSLSIYWIGAYVISGGPDLAFRMARFSDMIVFTAYAMQVVMAFMMMVMIFMILPRASVAAARIEEVIDAEPGIRDGPLDGAPEGSPVGEVEFRGVGFRYPGAPGYVLKDVSFKASRGETVAFIGSTGSGKSTLVNLIPRFYDATEGQVLVDGVDVRDYTLRSLRGKLGYVPQKAVLFAGTVSSNVRYGMEGERSDADAERAVRIAQAADFVEAMGGCGAAVSQNGTNVSGGQKQRLSIARAVCRRPEIYIFDDTFSALDYRTDRALRGALRRETEGATSIIVAQRIGTIMDADRIVVLDEGRVAGVGTHRELLRDCPVYREIASTQLTEEEMAR